ncbi:MAG: glycosyl hydrolase family 17 protein [Anaerolineae bacterium]|jgi:exo-beta-1,3-glucanase (GH17 family)
MNRWLRRLLSAVFVLSLGLLLGPSLVAAEPAPLLQLDHVPPYGVQESILGTVLHSRPGLAVSGYLQVSEGGRIWGPKPTWVTPSVPVEEDGSFWLQFITGGDDIDAVVLYVLLVPAEYVPDSDYEETARVALDQLVVTRTPEGQVTILPREGKWQRADEPVAAVAEPEPQAVEQAVVSRSPLNPRLSAPSIALNYSPYTDGQSPNLGSHIPLRQMERHLRTMRPQVDTLRTFGVSGELLKLYPLAHTFGYRVYAGAWLGGAMDDPQIKSEIDVLVDVAKRGWCDAVVVGSECLHRGDLSALQLARYLRYARAGLQGQGVAVTTSDTAAALLSYPTLVAECDVVMATYYPFFEGVSIDEAADALATMYGRLQAAYPDKEIIISETGWPTAGSPEGEAVPSEANAARYFAEVYAWAEAEGVEVAYFAAFDEGWKVEGSKGDVGAHWGHRTAAGVLKPEYRAVYPCAEQQGCGEAPWPTATERLAELQDRLERWGAGRP